MLFLTAFLVSLSFSFLCYIGISIAICLQINGLLKLLQGCQKVLFFLFHLSMPIGNATWHAGVGSFYALKTLLQYKLKTRKVTFSFQTVYFLFLALSYIFKSILNNVHYFFKCMVTKSMSLITKLTYIFLFICIVNLLCRCGDIETNPGPKYSSLTFCHWNLNALTAHDSIKILLLQAYILQHNYDIICLSETFLNFSIESNDDRISIDRYNLIRSDHPSNSKRGGVCI